MFCKNNTVEYRKLLEGVELQTLVHGEKTLMGRFKLARGAKIPPHKHPHEQTGLLISGRLLFTVENKEREVETGDSWCLPGGREHAVVALEDSVVVEIFSPVRADYLPDTQE
ncbi:cupin domain-containing protein [Desulfopila sp. IMCC35006]|uniref:cupin domain-containing protein n=1 Tax=Desulfopila sp. IMCC35006 TaxID=2569542 RepID=UPI0010AD7A1C|nr:cupin domain-containing protein [Desulfopila sp. IMCC35006]TKB25253.1 cupin domain-containing protein [Desulfopila sp. IMCC35006]